MESVSSENSYNVVFVSFEHAELRQTHVNQERTLKLLHQQKWESRYALNSQSTSIFFAFFFVCFSASPSAFDEVSLYSCMLGDVLQEWCG